MNLRFNNAYLLPIFDYCCTIWGKDNKSYINKINILQKRAAKLILNNPIRAPIDGLLQDAMPVNFRSILFTSYILTIFKQRTLLP